MKILSIDYGQKKIGIAIAESKIARPYTVLRYDSEEKVLKKIANIIEKFGIEKIIVGLSEGKSAERSKIFAQRLFTITQTPFEYVDETLSTQKAQELSIEAGIKRSKRKRLEDSYAAAVMLQLYIENNV